MTVRTAGAPPARDVALELARRAILRGGPMLLGRYALPHLVTGASSPLHDDLNAWHVREATRPPGALDAYAAPRGHGKTTAGVELGALWHVATCTRRYVIVASDTWTQAVRRLETLSREVEDNPTLRALYPRLRPARDGQGNLVAWRDDELAFECGCRVVGVGAGGSIRGAKAGANRPDLLLFDDLEDEQSVASPRGLDRRLRWITRTALALAGPLRGISALWVGTILTRGALLNAATGAALEQGQDRPEWARAWTPHVYRAELPDTPVEDTPVVDPDTGEPVHRADGTPLTYPIGQPLWAELTRADLAAIRYKVGAASYAAEYLADPVEDGTRMLAPPRVAGWLNPTAPPLERLARLDDGTVIPVASMTRAAALDPQYADVGAHDPDLGAVAVVGQAGPRTFLLDAWVGRDRHGQARRLVDLAARWGCFAARVEANAAQVVTADAAAADGRVPIVARASHGGKVDRALGLAARLGDAAVEGSGRVWVLPDAAELVPYLETFPHGRYDDPVDAVVMALDLAAGSSTGPAGASSGPAVGGARSGPATS